MKCLIKRTGSSLTQPLWCRLLSLYRNEHAGNCYGAEVTALRNVNADKNIPVTFDYKWLEEAVAEQKLCGYSLCDCVNMSAKCLMGHGWPMFVPTIGAVISQLFHVTQQQKFNYFWLQHNNKTAANKSYPSTPVSRVIHLPAECSRTK